MEQRQKLQAILKYVVILRKPSAPKNKSLKDSACAVEEKTEIDELSPFIECAHRYLQIAFAEDLYLYCQANNINFEELSCA